MPVNIHCRRKGRALLLLSALAAILACLSCGPPPAVDITFQGPARVVRSCPPLLVRYVADGNYSVDAARISEMMKSQFPYPSGREFEAVASSALEAAGCRTTKTTAPMKGPEDFAPLAAEAREQGLRYVLLAFTKLPKMQIIDHQYEGWARYVIPVYDSFAMDKQTVVLDYDDGFVLYDALKQEVVRKQEYGRQARKTFEIAYEENEYNKDLVRTINRLFVDTQSTIMKEWLQDMDKALNGPAKEQD